MLSIVVSDVKTYILLQWLDWTDWVPVFLGWWLGPVVPRLLKHFKFMCSGKLTWAKIFHLFWKQWCQYNCNHNSRHRSNKPVIYPNCSTLSWDEGRLDDIWGGQLPMRVPKNSNPGTSFFGPWKSVRPLVSTMKSSAGEAGL